VSALFSRLVSVCVFVFVSVWVVLSIGTAYAQQAGEDPALMTLSVELPVNDLSGWLTEVAPPQFVGDGEKQVCKRLLGMKACGNAKWQYQVDRTGEITIPAPTAERPGLTIAAPLRVNGRVGVDGDVGRALGIDAVPVAAALTMLVNVNVTGTPQGCPVVTATVIPEWAGKPTARLPGNIKISLTDALESALNKQVARWQQVINEKLDCDLILTQLLPLWSACYVDATRPETGPALWTVIPKQLHWSVQTERANDTLGLVVGMDTAVSAQFGLSEDAIAQRLRISDCSRQWDKLQTPVTTIQRATDHSSSVGARLVFDPALASNSQQGVKLNVTHEAMSSFAESQYANRNLGKDEGGSEVVLKSVDLLPGTDDGGAAIKLQTNFNATVRSGGGFKGWVQSALGFGEKELNGVMSLDAKPIWNTADRSLEFEQLKATVTQLEPGSKLSLTNAAFALMQRHVQKTLTEQSVVPLGDSIDSLSTKINETVDQRVSERLAEFGATWQSNTASIEIRDILAAGKGMSLDAQINADWIISFSSESWPRDLEQLKQ